MTRVDPWVQQLTEAVLGGSPVEIGKRYQHPQDGLIEITSGQYWGEYGISNFWTWKVIETGETKSGYAGPWEEHPHDE